MILGNFLKASAGILAIAIIVITGIIIWNLSDKQSLIRIQQSYITDFSDDRKLLGASHNVFVGKIIGKKGVVQFPGDMPGEIYEVEVLSNIKGKEKGIMTVTKEGGCIDGKCYILEGDIGREIPTEVESLKIGGVYILATRKDEIFGDIIISHPAGKTYISDNADMIKNQRIKSLKKAYTEEILFDGDILGKRDINAFSKLSEGEKDKIQKSIQE